LRGGPSDAANGTSPSLKKCGYCSYRDWGQLALPDQGVWSTALLERRS
jgi:hypothetical protein